jgi:hypothetical protein
MGTIIVSRFFFAAPLLRARDPLPTQHRWLLLEPLQQSVTGTIGGVVGVRHRGAEHDRLTR